MIALFIWLLPLNSQKWVEMMQDHEVNFYETQQAFEEYWQDRTVRRGLGWKQFKRWAYFMAPRVYPSGKIPAPNRAARAYEAYLQEHAVQSTDRADWTSLGPDSWETVSYNPGIGRINCIAADPNNSDVLYAGAPSGGFWKSVDGGQSWYTTTDALTALGVSAVAVDPSDSQNIYLGSGDGDGGNTYSIGVMKSTDGGESWMETGLQWEVTETRQISDIIIHPGQPHIVFAAANNGIFKSTDSGDSWLNVQSGDFKDLAFKPGDPSVVYACGSRFYRSEDGGNSFTQISSGLMPEHRIGRLAMAVTDANDEYVYLVASDIVDSGFLGLYRSTDSGRSFDLRSDSPNILGYEPDGSDSGGQGWYDLAIAASAQNSEDIFVGGVNIWRSLDGGANWEINGYWYYPDDNYPYVHADIHALNYHHGYLFAGCDGGIWQTDDNGQTWQDISFGMVTTQFYRMGDYEDDPYLIMGGTQDNGTNRYRNNIWTHVYGSDGMETAINARNPDTMYASYYNGGLLRSSDGGASFYGIADDIDESGSWVTPYTLHPQNPQTLYAGFVNVWKSEDGGDSWFTISNFDGSTLRSLAVAPSDPNYIYTATQTLMYKTSNGGASWQDITANLPTDSASITYITVADDHPEHVWVTFSGYKDGIKVYQSEDGGLNWINISGTLPNLPVNCITREQANSNDALYVGTDVGVYYKDNSMSDWEAFNHGLPNVIVDELEIHNSAGLVRAASFGRGMWESPLVSGVSAMADKDGRRKQTFVLFDNYPNPFNPETTIRYRLRQNVHVKLIIYDLMGRKVRTLVDEQQSYGQYRILWHGHDDSGEAVSAGIYYYRLTGGRHRQMGKMLLVK